MQRVWNTRLVRTSLASSLTLISACVCLTTAADYKALANAHARAVPATGEAGVVVQIEAPGKSKDGKTSAWHYAPDPAHANFSAVQFSVDSAARTSTHSTTVARLFYGKGRSVARGISRAHVFSANTWGTGLLRWDLGNAGAEALFPGSVVNHSWVGRQSNTVNARMLRRLDYSAVLRNTVNVYGVRKKGNGDPLFSSAFNGISVGGAHHNIATAYAAVDDVYTGGRYRPEIVAPNAYASSAAAIVSASVVRLNALAIALDIPPMVEHRSNSPLLPVELVKALLMVSAKKNFEYLHKEERTVYRFGADGMSDNGLDKRYGAGMLDVGAAEALLKSHVEASSGQSKSGGWYYYPGAANSPDMEPKTPTVSLTPKTELSVSLVWLASLSSGKDQKLVATVRDLDLCVVEKDSGKIIAESSSTGDATEHLTIAVSDKADLQVVVINKVTGKVDERKSTTSVVSPYALAWHAVGNQAPAN